MDLIENENKSQKPNNNSNILNKTIVPNTVLDIPNWEGSMSPAGYNIGNCWAYASSGVAEGLLNRLYKQIKPTAAEIKIQLDADNLTSGPDLGFASISSGARPEQGVNSFPHYDHGYFKVSSYSVSYSPSINAIKSQLQYSCPYPKVCLGRILNLKQGY